LRKRFPHGSLGAGLLFPCGRNPSLEVDDLAACIEELRLRNDMLARERLKHGNLLLGQPKAVLQA
jgi:hypothetical protein